MWTVLASRLAARTLAEEFFNSIVDSSFTIMIRFSVDAFQVLHAAFMALLVRLTEDASSGEIHYSLPRQGRTSIRASLRSSRSYMGFEMPADVRSSLGLTSVEGAKCTSHFAHSQKR